MNSNVIKLLLGLCLVSIAILLIEWRLMISSNELLEDSLPTADKQQYSAIDLPVLDSAKLPIESYSDMVDRPLFIKGRKAVITAEQEEILFDVSKIEDLILLGIYSIEGNKSALFNKQGLRDKKYLKKVEGDDVFGWMLKEIRSDRVILEQSGTEHTVMLRKPRKRLPAKKKRKTFKKPKTAIQNSIKLKS